VIDGALVASAEARKLNSEHDRLHETYVKFGVLKSKDKETEIRAPSQLLAAVLASGHKGIELQRYKGLGEMNADQLWETTLDANARTLLQVKIAHADTADAIFTRLMGDVVEPRREFIQDNALSVTNLDV